MNYLNKQEMLDLNSELIDLLKTTDDIVYFSPSADDLGENENMYNEYDLLGYFISKHPLDDYKGRMKQLENIDTLKAKRNSEHIHIGGIISSFKEIRTKKNDLMASFTLEDTSGRIDVIVFPRTYALKGSLLNQNALIEIKGKVEVNEREINSEMVKSAKVIGTFIHPLEQVKEVNEIILKVNSEDDLNIIKDLLISNKGHVPVSIDYENCRLPTPYKLLYKKDIIDSLRGMALVHEVEQT